MNRKQYIYLFSTCIVVKGYLHCIICDLQRHDYSIIPNSLAFLLENLPNERCLENLKKEYEKEDQIIFDSYIEFLLEREYIFIDNHLHSDRFPILDTTNFDSPNIISNAIIEYDDNYSITLLKKIINELDSLRCESIEIRFYGNTFEKKHPKILNLFNNTGIRSIYVLLNSFDFDKDFFKNLSLKYKRIREIGVFNFDNTYDTDKIDSPYFPVFLSNDVLSNKFCGLIKNYHFSVNIQMLSEAQKFNSCLNKKIAVDIDGNIKNCPSFTQSFGNIKNTSLKNALNHDNFKKYWNLTKDEIEVCKLCEFRYICTDCRAYTERTHTNEEGLDTSKPLKCGYDPYTGEWEEWSTNPLKEKAINYYGMQSLVKK